MLTFKVADVGNYQLSFGVKKLVVFKISGYKYVRAGCNGLFQQKAARAAAHRYPFNVPAGVRSMPDDMRPHFLFQVI